MGGLIVLIEVGLESKIGMEKWGCLMSSLFNYNECNRQSSAP